MIEGHAERYLGMILTSSVLLSNPSILLVRGSVVCVCVAGWLTHGLASLQMAFTMHQVEGSDDPMQILKDLTAQRQRVLGRKGVFGYDARFKSKEAQTGMCRVCLCASSLCLEFES